MRALLALGLCAVAVQAQPQPKPEKGDSKAVVKVYDAKHLLGDRGKASGLADADALVRVLLDALPELRDPKGAALAVLDDGKLEVRAAPAVQTEVRDLLDALARLQDVAVNLETKVYELDAAGYEKLLKALPKLGRGKPGSPVLLAAGREYDLLGDHKQINAQFEEMNKVLATGRKVHTASGRFVNGAEATFAARQTVVTYRPHEPVGKNEKPAADAPPFVKDGFRLVGTPVVSADRRYVRLALTEKSVQLLGVTERELGEIKGLKLVGRSPDLEDVGGTGSATVSDGGFMVFKLAYAPKDKVLVAVLSPKIYIRAEEDEVKRREGEKK